MRSSVFAVLILPLAGWALDVPAGTELQVRLKSKISTLNAKPKDPIEAVVIAPVMVESQFAIPAGAVVRGTVEKAARSTKPDERASLLLSFHEIEIAGEKLKVTAQVTGIDNAREKVDEQGAISGILASETVTGQLDAGIRKIGEKYAGFADILGIAKKVAFQPADNDITYDAGAELTLKLTAPLAVKAAASAGPAAKVKPIADEKALLDLIAKEPFQTMAERPAKPSDITNLLLIGTEEQVRQAFTEAGWKTAAALSAEAKFETVRALAEDRGYSEAPVSVLLLEGKPPSMVFEKLTNTFAQRHHLRIWLRPSQWEGKPVWAVAATHDTGISFSEQNRTFIHKIDSEIDRERAKVVNDLLFTGRVGAIALVDRPQVPTRAQNATGDDLVTDARIAVLVFE